PLGNDPDRGPPAQPQRRHRGRDARSGPGPGRDHRRGPGAGRLVQRQPAHLPTRRQHHRRQHRHQVRRGGHRSRRAADRLGPRAFRHHPGRQHAGAGRRLPLAPHGRRGPSMTAAVLAEPVGLRRPRLSRLQLGLVAAGSIGLTGALFAATPAQGVVDYVLVAYLVFLAVQTAVSYTVEGARAARNRLAMTLLVSAVVVALIPLVAVLYYTVRRGVQAISPGFLTHSMRGVGPLDSGGGAYHAMIGTLEQVLIAGIISIPLGLLAAIYIVEYGRGKLASWVRFFVDVMTGIPSIVGGLFIFAFWVLGLHKGFSGFAAGMA